MKCPYCGSLDSKVVDKRETENHLTTRRRRECLACQKRYTTYERLETSVLTIVKKNGSKEPFEKDKIIRGIKLACEKRPVTEEQIQEIAETVEAELLGLDQLEIPSKKVGSIIIKKLKKIDKLAYLRFASVYKEFDLEEFDKELHRLQN